jgi:hypothetical protein
MTYTYICGMRSHAMCAVGVTVAAVLTGCSQAHDTTPKPRSEQVSRRHYAGNTWPLTVDRGTLSCQQTDYRGHTNIVVFTTMRGTKYALNGSAANTGKYHDLRGIWAKSPATENDPVERYRDATYLIGSGLNLCERTPG